MSELRVAIVGCGKHGSRYAEALASGGTGGRLIGLCRTNPEQLRALAEKYHIKKVYTDYEALLMDEEVDAVIVATPNNLHADVAVRALTLGKHVLLEKPLGVNVREARAVAAAVEKSRAKLMVAHNFRYHPVYKKAKSLMPVVGKPYLLMCCKRQEPSSGWRTSRSLAGGGTVLDLGVHLFDMADWLTGTKPRRAYCVMTRAAGAEVENSFTAVLEGDGVTAVLDASQLSKPRFERLEVSGGEGHLVADRYRSEVQLVTSEGRRSMGVAEQDESLKLMVKGFVEAVREGREPPVTVWDGLLTMELSEACYRSAETGMPEKL